MILIRSSLFDQAMSQLQPLSKHQENSAAVVEAVGLCALAVATDPSKLPESRRKVVDMAGKAMWAATSQRPKDAEDGFQQLLAAYPNEPGVHYAFGLYLMDTDQHAALAAVRERTEHESRPLAGAAGRSVSRDARGRAGCRDAVGGAGAEAGAGQLLLVVRRGDGPRAAGARTSPRKAVPLFEESVKLQPDNAQTHFYLEQAYRRVGRKTDAQRERAEFVRLKSQQDPRSLPGVVNSTNQLNSLMSHWNGQRTGNVRALIQDYDPHFLDGFPEGVILGEGQPLLHRRIALLARQMNIHRR